jgi:Tn3 transposase DDE domain
MHPLTTLVCGEIPVDGAIREVFSHLGESLDGLLAKSRVLRESNDMVDLALFGPYLVRAALEVALTAITARFDPYRVLAIRKSQLSSSYDYQSRNPLAFSWADDVQGKGKGKDWDALPNVETLQRALLCNHFHDLFWEEAFIKMLDATQILPGSDWITRLRKVDPAGFTHRNRTEAAKLYSELSKAVHHEFVIPAVAQYDPITVNDLMTRTWELIAGLDMTACFSPALRTSDVAFHNIVSMTKAIDRLKAEGQEISDEVLAAVSPYQTSHINRFGQYQLHARRAPDPLPFLRKPPNVEISTVDAPGLAAAG